MPFQTVICEVRWIAETGLSGTELPPSCYDVIGEFETEGDAARALAEAGLTRYPYGWRGSYSYGTIKRILKETGYSKSDFKMLRAENDRLREALEPFARAADALDLERWDDESIDGSSAIVTGLHCRNARAAIGEEKK